MTWFKFGAGDTECLDCLSVTGTTAAASSTAFSSSSRTIGPRLQRHERLERQHMFRGSALSSQQQFLILLNPRTESQSPPLASSLPSPSPSPPPLPSPDSKNCLNCAGIESALIASLSLILVSILPNFSSNRYVLRCIARFHPVQIRLRLRMSRYTLKRRVWMLQQKARHDQRAALSSKEGTRLAGWPPRPMTALCGSGISLPR